MAILDEVLEKYKQGKFKKCLELIKLLKESGDIENIVLENCELVCESLVKIQENNPDKIYEMQEQLYLFYEKVTSVEILNSVPLQLKLIATFNFIFWLLFYNDVELEINEVEEYLEIVNGGLLRVLGKQVNIMNASSPAEKILINLNYLKDIIINENYETVLLVFELVIIVILYVVKLKRPLIKECLKIARLFIEESKYAIKSGDEFLQVKQVPLYFLKFGLCGTAALYSEFDLKIIDYLNFLESVFLFLLEDFKGSLKSLQKNLNTRIQSLWNYLVILNSFELQNWDLCVVFLVKISSIVVQKNLKARCHIMQGKLNSVERNHKEALHQFETALMLSPNCPTIYYYIGQEYGKMGLIDLMVENFEKLVKALYTDDTEDDFKPNFETTLLNWIHPADEITEAEAHYALAVSYGLNENFKNAAETFEKILQGSNDELLGKKKRIIELPNFVTILHEASIMNLLLGNLTRAEQIVLDAIDRYVPQKPSGICSQLCTTLSRDIEWLQKVIQHELLESDLEPKQFLDEIYFSENLLFFFSQNVIALLILSEIQRIQEIEDHKMTLNNVFSIFSKYLALMNKKQKMDEEEKHVLTLVKALAGKTCVKIASIKIKQNQDSDVEKMFQRALSCNKGDKDALYNYYQFLMKKRKTKEAVKLWNTFSKEKEAFEVDSLQSFSLRYFLTDKISKRELEKIQQEIYSTGKMSSPVSPSLKDLPKVKPDLKSQLECFNQRNLKDVNTLEKNVLPSAQDVAAEKTQKALLEGVEAFDTAKLKHTETQEKNPLPDKEVVYQEKVHQKLFDGVEHFDKTTMKHAETQEKNSLPDREVIELEKDKLKFITGIESFDPTKLKHTETLEKNPLPTKEIIDQEKKA